MAIKTFKKLTLDKDTVLPTVTPLGTSVADGLRKAGAQSASDYCSGSTACSIFLVC